MKQTSQKLQFKERYIENFDKGGSTAEYDLFGVVEHIGPTIKEGHYVAYVKGSSQIWFKVRIFFLFEELF